MLRLAFITDKLSIEEVVVAWFSLLSLVCHIVGWLMVVSELTKEPQSSRFDVENRWKTWWFSILSIAMPIAIGWSFYNFVNSLGTVMSGLIEKS